MLAIIPVNDPLRGKQRLSSHFANDLRAELVEAMLLDVIDACTSSTSITDVMIVTPNPAIAPATCTVMTDPGRGHAQAIETALERAGAADSVVILMADCPLVTGEAIDRLVGSAAPLALAPAQDGGTNALAMRPANLLRPAFGVPGSSAITMATARELGLNMKLVNDPVFAIDLDDPRDIERIVSRSPTTRTSKLLAQRPQALEPAP